jgi:hypothetical protein
MNQITWDNSINALFINSTNFGTNRISMKLKKYFLNTFINIIFYSPVATHRKMSLNGGPMRHADKDESTLYMDAVGGSSRGRIRGFGSMLDHKVPTANTQARSSVSGVTHNGTQKTYTDKEVNAILTQERDQRLNEEREERKRMQAENNIMFRQLFAMMGMRRPNYQVRCGIRPNFQLFKYCMKIYQLMYISKFLYLLSYDLMCISDC